MGKELCGEQGEGIVHGKNLGFCVKVASGGSLHAASGNAKGSVLKSIVFLCWCGRCWKPDGSSVEDYGSDDEFVGGDYCFFCWPKLVPARAFKVLMRGLIGETRLLMCGPKVK